MIAVLSKFALIRTIFAAFRSILTSIAEHIDSILNSSIKLENYHDFVLIIRNQLLQRSKPCFCLKGLLNAFTCEKAGVALSSGNLDYLFRLIKVNKNRKIFFDSIKLEVGLATLSEGIQPDSIKIAFESQKERMMESCCDLRHIFIRNDHFLVCCVTFSWKVKKNSNLYSVVLLFWF